MTLSIHELHAHLGASFGQVNGAEVVDHYGSTAAETRALQTCVGLMDLSFRGRLCLTGADRVRLLHGQITNDVQKLSTGQGCYAALVTAKGKMESDLNVYALANELLLDFEPGLTSKISERLEHYVIADDVQIIDVAPHYGLISCQGPRSLEAVVALGWTGSLPTQPLAFHQETSPTLGECYIMNHARLGTMGFDLFIPTDSLGMVWDKMALAVSQLGGVPCGWLAWEQSRISAGVPRFGVDMDSTNLPPETGIEKRAISYAKGCYIGQEVIARIRTYGQVAKALRGLRFSSKTTSLPKSGDRLFRDGKDIGYITSAVRLDSESEVFAMGYIRREANAIGGQVIWLSDESEYTAEIVPLPRETMRGS